LVDGPAWFQSLANQTLPADSYEVLIVDSSHTTSHGADFHDFNQTGRASGNISYHRIERGGRARALNYGLNLASADVIVFLGDDCQVPPNFAEAHLRFHQTHPAIESVAAGSALFPSELRTPFSDWLEKSGRLFGEPFHADMTAISDNFFYAANASVKRAMLDRAGRFDERFTDHAWDDFEFGERLRAAGMKSEFLAEASVLHMHRIELPDREEAMRLAGAAARVYGQIHPGPHPWTKSVDSTRLRRSLHLGLAYLRRVMRNGDAVEQQWIHRLDAAFVEGYRRSRESTR
jgi:GT2 family glycosyltransferase